MQPFGHSLGGLHAQPMDEQLLGELALGLKPRAELGDLVADRDRLERTDVELVGSQRAEEIGQADAVVAGLAGEDEPLELAFARRLWVPDDELVAVGVAVEIAEQRARMEVGLLAPHALEPGSEVLLHEPLPLLALDAAAAPVELEEDVGVEVVVDLVEVHRNIART